MLYKYMLYFITKLIHGKNIEFNAIAGVPRPGPLLPIYLFFQHTSINLCNKLI